MIVVGIIITTRGNYMASNFSLQTHPYGHESQGNDHQLKKLLIVKQILLVSASGNVKRPVWRMCVLMLE